VGTIWAHIKSSRNSYNENQLTAFLYAGKVEEGVSLSLSD